MTTTITTLLLNEIRDAVKTELEAEFTHGAIGNDSTTPVVGDTTLGSEDFRDTIDDFDSSVANAITASLFVLTSENNGNTVREVGWFDAASNGNLWTHNVLTEILKTADIQLFLDTTIAILVVEV